MNPLEKIYFVFYSTGDILTLQYSVTIFVIASPLLQPGNIFCLTVLYFLLLFFFSGFYLLTLCSHIFYISLWRMLTYISIALCWHRETCIFKNPCRKHTLIVLICGSELFSFWVQWKQNYQTVVPTTTYKEICPRKVGIFFQEFDPKNMINVSYTSSGLFDIFREQSWLDIHSN